MEGPAANAALVWTERMRWVDGEGGERARRGRGSGGAGGDADFSRGGGLGRKNMRTLELVRKRTGICL
jgi:hypothetical protein